VCIYYDCQCVIVVFADSKMLRCGTIDEILSRSGSHCCENDCRDQSTTPVTIENVSLLMQCIGAMCLGASMVIHESCLVP
jgi:hypothetical protein